LGALFFVLFGNQNGNQDGAPQPAIAQPGEQPTDTPELIPQTLGDAPTSVPSDTPTLVVQAAVSEEDASAGNDSLELNSAASNVETTSEPTVEATSEPTAEPPPPRQNTQSRTIPASTLQGVIAYPVFNGTSYDIYLGQADGSGTEFFLPDASQPVFSPDGSQIAYHSWRLDARGLMTMALDGTNQQRVVTFFEDQLPTWTPDGSQIVLFSRRSGSRKSELIITNNSEGGEDTVFAEGEYPTIGQNGQLVFKGWGVTAPGLRVADLPLENLRVLTEAGTDTAPAISPDGQKVAFMSRRDNNWEIYIVNIDGSELTRLTEDPAQDGLPTWSPDGNAIAYVSDRGGAWGVWAMTPTGADQQQLFAMEGSPDGFVGTDTFASRGWAEERISWKQ
jgi:TolB protein